jgi:hypothetical protein
MAIGYIGEEISVNIDEKRSGGGTGKVKGSRHFYTFNLFIETSAV